MRDPNIHLTFYFIGNVPAGQVDEIGDALLPVFDSQKEFVLQFESLGPAPKHKPRMVWATYRKSETFTDLAEKIHHVMGRYIKANKFYFKEPVPHITLARFNSTQKVTEILLPEKALLPDIRVDHCELWETIHSEGRSDYHSERSFSFSD